MEELNRRDFLGAAALAAAGAALPGALRAADGKEPIRAVLMHLGYNMWSECLPPTFRGEIEARRRPDVKLRCQDAVWKRAVDHAAARKLNMVVIDLGEGLVYPSHPELAIEGSWSVEKLRAELKRMRAMGLEPIPKLNFSATHDGWFGEYHRMLSTSPYYQACKDLIRDVMEIFDNPRLFHLGWDEEHVNYAKNCNFAVARQKDLWWHDMLYTVKCVEDLGARAWIWSDHAWWGDPERFYRLCPKSVVQSNWYYDNQMAGFDPVENKTGDATKIKAFLKLEEAGFDQIPTGSNWRSDEHLKAGRDADYVMKGIVDLGRKVIAPERLLGFMTAPWVACTESLTKWNKRSSDALVESIDQLADAVAS